MKHVKIIFLIAFFIPCIVHGCELGELAHSVPYLSLPQTNCTTNADCISVKCTGTASDRPFMLGLVFSVCDVKPSVTILVHAPRFGIKDWNATLEDGNEINIPGYNFPVEGNKTVPVYVGIGLKKANEDEFNFNLTLKACINDYKTLPECPMINRTIENKKVSFMCPSKSDVPAESKKCQISVPFTCGSNETCQQIGTGIEGFCVPIVEPSPEHRETSPTPVITTTPTPSKHETELLAINISVPLLIAALVVSFVIAAYRRGWVRKLRRLFESRNQFEQLSSASRMNDDDDDPLPL